MTKLVFINAFLACLFITPSTSYPPCDSLRETCTNDTFSCKSGCQANGNSSCCPNNLTPTTNGICFGVNNSTECSLPGTFSSRLQCCISMGEGIGLAVIENLTSYEAFCANLPAEIPDGAAVLVGIARINGTVLVPTEKFKAVGNLQFPPPFVYWATDATLSNSINYTVGYMIKNDTNALKWYTSDDTGPSWIAKTPFVGYFGVCQYFPQYEMTNGTSTTTTSSATSTTIVLSRNHTEFPTNTTNATVVTTAKHIVEDDYVFPWPIALAIALAILCIVLCGIAVYFCVQEYRLQKSGNIQTTTINAINESWQQG